MTRKSWEENMQQVMFSFTSKETVQGQNTDIKQSLQMIFNNANVNNKWAEWGTGNESFVSAMGAGEVQVSEMNWNWKQRRRKKEGWETVLWCTRNDMHKESLYTLIHFSLYSNEREREIGSFHSLTDKKTAMPEDYFSIYIQTMMH